MTIAFTICSVNYLAQARTLGDSLLKNNPEVRFIIGLVDKLESKHLEQSMIPIYELLPIDKIEIQNFDSLCERYNITELNTAVKPFYIDYFFKKYADVENVIYFDPDIIVFKPISRLLESLTSYDFVLTPHTNTPYNDDLWQNEEDLNNAGIYNLGFIALHRSQNAIEFIEWWKEKLSQECVIDLCNGLFVDQHWVDFLPIFWDNVLIDSYLGYNVAYWNLHERQISFQNDTCFAVKDELVFFHYSGYSPKKPTIVSKYQNRIDFKTRTDIQPLFDIYHDSLIKNGQEYYEPIPCDYIKPIKVERLVRVRNLLKSPFEKISKHLLRVK
jgi:hypothetical protein